jgi:type IV secretory pathway VirB2 component (pilin)
MTYLKAIVPAVAVIFLATAPSLAHGNNGKGKKLGHHKKISRSVPGPVAGLGLPAGVVIGGYMWWRRRSANQNKTKAD